jgi:hypothetical protein
MLVSENKCAPLFSVAAFTEMLASKVVFGEPLLGHR